MSSTSPKPSRYYRWLNAPQDARGLAAFRILFGALMIFAVVRFWTNGWIHELYIAPSTHFTYLGFEWVRPWPAWGMYGHFGVMGAAALGLMIGAWTRISAAVFFLTFTYAELIEKAAYLNHYYLVSLLALLLIFVPAGATWSVDAWRRNPPSSVTVARWAYVLLRSQIAIVYLFAGLAKLNSDWLVRAEPLQTWLRSYGDLPLVGHVLGEPWVAYAMSWGGALFDLTIVGWLLLPRTRLVAYASSVFFHGTIWLLFPVGVFSWVMLISATLFFSPSWPRHLKRPGPSVATPDDGAPRHHAVARPLVYIGVAYLVVQLLIPLRFTLYPGNVNWTEEGFRFSWRVMLIEKTGLVEYEVRTGNGQRQVVYPRSELTPLQYQMMSNQPDMIHEYALQLARRFERDGRGTVRVHAHAWVALNGRPSQRIVRPDIDLAAEPRTLRASDWIVPLGLPAELHR
ncbi:MAG: HTTM domain-containing protein [Proteobacteria bacterium]|nr:HTTM domain-containing protein [Pseudomonadota bacterium]